MSGLTNPFSQSAFGTTNIGLTNPSKPFGTQTQQGGVTRDVPSSLGNYSLPTQTIKLEKSAEQKAFEEMMRKKELEDASSTTNWWKKRTTFQKSLIIGGSVLIVAVVFWVVTKNKNK